MTNPPLSSLVRIDVAAQSHPGHCRANNEDHFLVTRLSRTLQTLITSLPSGDVAPVTEEVNYAMIVADGMGGHAAGEVASRMALSALVALALDTPDWILRADDGYQWTIEDRAREGVRRIGTLIVDTGRREKVLRGMGTTLTAARSLGRDLVVTHVGDSRAYLFRGGTLYRLTRDHTYAQQLVDAGMLAPADVATSGYAHVLTNAVGGSSRDVHVDTDHVLLEDGDRLLLCSDGLTDLVDDEAISAILRERTTSQDACARLVQLALDNGGRDNVTVIVAAYTIPAEPSASTAVDARDETRP